MNNKSADQTAWMRRLICTFVVRIGHKIHFRMTWPNLQSRLSINPHLPDGPFHPYQLDNTNSNFRDVWYTFFHFYLIFNRNFCKQTVKTPDQTPRSAVSDLGLHCLPRSHKRDARLLWVNNIHNYNQALILIF